MSSIKEPTAAEIFDQMRRGVARAVQEIRKAGLPLYYSDSKYPGEIVEERPGGSRRIVILDDSGNVVIVRDLFEAED